jgi:hypothetical protein
MTLFETKKEFLVFYNSAFVRHISEKWLKNHCLEIPGNLLYGI